MTLLLAAFILALALAVVSKKDMIIALALIGIFCTIAVTNDVQPHTPIVDLYTSQEQP